MRDLVINKDKKEVPGSKYSHVLRDSQGDLSKPKQANKLSPTVKVRKKTEPDDSNWNTIQNPESSLRKDEPQDWTTFGFLKVLFVYSKR